MKWVGRKWKAGVIYHERVKQKTRYVWKRMWKNQKSIYPELPDSSGKYPTLKHDTLQKMIFRSQITEG